MVPDDGMDFFSSLWEVLLTAGLCRLLAAGSDPGAGSAFLRNSPGKAGSSAADVSPGLREQGSDSCCIIHFSWVKQNGDSGQLCAL